jgi:hypothetical protein
MYACMSHGCSTWIYPSYGCRGLCYSQTMDEEWYHRALVCLVWHDINYVALEAFKDYVFSYV